MVIERSFFDDMCIWDGERADTIGFKRWMLMGNISEWKGY
jgi:hypothetical protein